MYDLAAKAARMMGRFYFLTACNLQRLTGISLSGGWLLCNTLFLSILNSRCCQHTGIVWQYLVLSVNIRYN